MIMRWIGRHAGLSVMAGTLAFGACDSPEPEAVTDSWPIESSPVLSIGTADGDDPYLLDRAYSSLMFDGGFVAVANSGSHEIRVFDETGLHVRTLGRHGSGPGEFRGNLTVYRSATDRLVVFDQSNWRVTEYTSDWTVVASAIHSPGSISEFLGPEWLYRSFWVRGAVTPIQRSVVRSTLAGLLPKNGRAVTFAILDGQGCLWLRSVAGPDDEWSVVSQGGTAIGVARLPIGLEVLQIGDNRILGRRIDSLGVETVQLYAFSRPSGCSGVKQDTASLQSVAVGETRAELVRGLEDLDRRQEQYYVDHASYANDVDSLQLSDGDFEFTVVRGDRRGWLAVVRRKGGNIICAAGVGYPTPALWRQGSPKCS